jgi:hypothetical protein
MRDIGILFREDEVYDGSRWKWWDVLEVGTFNNHAKFTTDRPNGHAGRRPQCVAQLAWLSKWQWNSTPLTPPHWRFNRRC